ncbi:Alpha-1,6-mannosylglycoprotein 6-beta-N-acetylglucosaminyltransferase B [Bagarius yarrelli]|uniref:alpha-1,6-mannosyl-glycoprotein 6-beta-N-acetylglucosaminyltransferase n=1 Tax=Bagarius yarrelli TaxID=175774 RepID=A0A556VC74_BAGYA|nr:Alpha-1,6-mannosylglycoprotein 6-beta-N-acetylglucosaminyltransferase B [Bagarius yarrelli]
MKRMETLSRLENANDTRRLEELSSAISRIQPAGLVERIQAIAQNVSNMAVRVEQILQNSMAASKGGIPYGSRRSLGSGWNRKGVSKLYEAADPRDGSAVGGGRAETRPKTAPAMERTEEGCGESVHSLWCMEQKVGLDAVCREGQRFSASENRVWEEPKRSWFSFSAHTPVAARIPELCGGEASRGGEKEKKSGVSANTWGLLWTILVHVGFLTEESGDVFSPKVLKGGPLGEMVQWADILTALYVLGQNLKISVSVKELQGFLGVPPGRGSCPLTGPLPFDLIYTDYHGLQQMKQHMGLSLKKHKCHIRVIDTFGTEPAYNHEEYATLHGYRTNWGYWNLNTRQYMTMFPHTPDNSFMGFVAEELNNTEKHNIRENKVKNMAVVYGKEASMWKGKEKFLEILHRYMEVHGTVYYETQRPPEVPAFVKNHGLLPQQDLQQLLRKAKLFIGFGFPYEGPAPLEAIANGCIFLQPKFQPPHSSLNHEFFRGKPTSREDFCGPEAWSFPANMSVVRSRRMFMREDNSGLISWAVNSTAPPCWPPITALRLTVSAEGQSCVDACRSYDLVCEPAFFRFINVQCEVVEFEMNHVFPAFSTMVRECGLQKEPLLFSCAGFDPKYRRVCPCRDFRKGQVALCRDCL